MSKEPTEQSSAQISTQISTHKEKPLRKNKLFIKNLPSDVTSKQLLELFSTVGPVKRCFTIDEPRNKSDKTSLRKCTGNAFVHYSFEKDALAALEQLQGRKLGGKPINLMLAKPRKSQNKKFSSDQTQDPNSKTSYVKNDLVPKPSERSRVVVLKGITNQQVFDKVVNTLKQSGLVVKRTVYPHPNNSEEAHIYFYHIPNAVAALNVVKTTFESQNITASLFNDKSTIQFQLIVRNLPFKCSEEEINTIFSRIGMVYEIIIPKSPNGEFKGFCFVRYTNKPDCEKAIQLGNQLKIRGRPIAVDYVVPGNVYKKSILNPIEGETKNSIVTTNNQKESDKKPTHTNFVDESSEDNEDAKSNELERKEESEESEEKSEEEASEKSSEEESDDQNDTINEKDDDVVYVDLDEQKITSNPNQTEKQTIAPRRPPIPMDEDTSLFIRHLTLETTKEQLEETFKKFGPLWHTLLVWDKELDQPKGTAFVRFKKKADADKALMEAYKSEVIRLGESLFLERADSINTESNITINGKKLVICRSKDKKALMTSQTKIQKPDKRNLHLANLGYIRADSHIYQELSTHEKIMREKAEKEKTAKLRNPNFHVSRTRLCFRNLPKTLDEREFKNAVLKAVRERPDEYISLKQVIIARSKDKLVNGVGVSLCYGFVEFKTHEHALRALEKMNANPSIWGIHKRPFVEFALENAKALWTMKVRKQHEAEKAEQKKHAKVRLRDVIDQTQLTEEEKRILDQEKKRLYGKGLGPDPWKQSNVRDKNQKSQDTRGGKRSWSDVAPKFERGRNAKRIKLDELDSADLQDFNRQKKKKMNSRPKPREDDAVISRYERQRGVRPKKKWDQRR